MGLEVVGPVTNMKSAILLIKKGDSEISLTKVIEEKLTSSLNTS